MQDYLIKAVGSDEQFRVYACVSTNLVEEARRRHNTWPIATSALGRTMTAALLLGANMKGEDLITIRVLGDGPLGAIVVTADARGNVRGYVQNPQVHLPSVKGKLAVGAAVGKGTLSISRDLGLKEPFTGTVQLVSGEIGEDLAAYLLKSEQTPSAVSLGVLVETDNSVRAAGGLILQLMPGAGEDVLQKLEQGLASMPPVSSLVDRGATPEDMVDMLTKELSVKVLDKSPVQFSCSCSRERLERVLISMGREELTSMIEEQGEAELQCHFCAQKYHFSKSDLQKILAEAEK
ncbi:molecular chaperone Hsp33 [Desulfohalotomaculum tongense]|uniref:Hsp33 family molecular chaperone HslO n=1 Tax=Desulforadius tongensis TaxID=1216062 RepID=UPI001958FE1C|nr:Hsp33 family molecular chaperone HslO [Desulforadius tongensis]MBM7855657.1 molecular chaperone Hsp33 [Desulforadius tongensis]